MTLDKKLACLRKKQGLSQADVSEKLDISRQAVSRWENGVAIPSIENLRYLSKLYHVSLEYLLDDTADETEKIEISDHRERDVDNLSSNFEKHHKYRTKQIIIIGICIVLIICTLFAVFVAAKPERTTTKIGDTIKENIDDVPKFQFEIEW
nr:helix-turn-helix transcriptional regulator [uncultured Flavonifractor sp.]